MKPVTLNLATRPFRNNVLVGSLLTVVGVGLLSATVYNLYVYLGYGSAYARLQQDQTDDRARIVKLQAEERRLSEEVRKRDFRRAYERGKLASELVRKSAFSWTLLFNTLEGVVPPDVVMTAIRPNIGADTIVLRIEGVAKNDAAFLSFQERLLKNPLFTRVFPASIRRLNPNLSDETFLLNCDYLPSGPPADLVAKKEGADAAGAPAAGAAGAAPAGAETTAATGEGQAAVPEPSAPAAAPTASAAAAGGATAPAPGTRVAQASMPVGRDGLPVDGDPVTVMAPGALHTPVAAAPEPGPAKKGGRRRETSADSGSKSTAPPARPAATPGSGPSKPGTTSAKKSPATAAEEDDTAPGTATGGPAAAPRTKPAATIDARTAGIAARASAQAHAPRDGRVWDPNVPRTMPPEMQALRAAEPKPPERAAPATRLDMPLSFTRAPVGDVYEKLAKAHGVRFEFGPGVDKAAPVTCNLQGRPLEQALEMVMLQTQQRVTRKANGVYRVEGPEAGREIGVAPVTEEPITGDAP